MTLMTVAFWASALLLVFAYAGYPMLIVLLARLRPVPVRKSRYLPQVTAVLCVHNAEHSIRPKLENLLGLNYPPHLLDIVVVCDGCTDTTAAAARALGSARITVVDIEARRGKSSCLDDGVRAASGEVLLMTDVRQRLEADALDELAANFADPRVGAVSGELRFESPDGGFAGSVDAYWRYEKMIRNAESRAGSVVGVTGALYAMRRSLYLRLPPGTVLDDVLLPMQVVKAGSRVVFEPGAVAWDRASSEESAERSRKVRTLAGNYQLVRLAPWLLLPWSNPIWFRFVCHKLLRLAAPWLLLLILAVTPLLALQHPFYFGCMCLALAAAAAVWAGRVSPWMADRWPVRLLNAFWYMNLYSAQALVAYVRNPRLHLW